MKLSKIRIENFGPYLGVHEIDLSVNDHAPVVVIYGENLHGKTSLLNAIRWCLYARALDRRYEPMAFRELVNYHAADSGEWIASVRLEFEHDSVPHQLERQMQADREPAEDSDFEIVRSLRVGGQFVPDQQIEERIAAVLHPDVSQFFLFDGEMLNRYEDLLADDSNSAGLIRRSIEQILGLPALQAIAKDLAHLGNNASRRQTRALEAAEKDVELGREAEQLREEMKSIDDDLAALEHELSVEQTEKGRIREARQRYADIEAEARELITLETDIERLEGEQAEQQARARDALSSAWWVPLTRRANEKLEAADERLRALSESFAAAQVSVAERQRIQEALEDGSCPTCETELTKATQAQLEEKLKQDPQVEEAATHEDLARLAETVRQLREIADSGPAQRLVAAEREHRRLGIEVRRKQRRADEIQDALRGSEVSEISSLEHKYDQVVERIRAINDNLSQQQGRREEAQASLRRVESQIRRSPAADPQIAAEAGAYEQLQDVFEEAVDQFRSQLRSSVEDAAAGIFVELIAADDLTALRINEQYGLRILNDVGRELTTRSAGAEQVVALSLIGALNRCAVREGPVVMDTPFGRLDRRHRENILRYVPRFGSQVVLLVQSGEFERDRDLEYLGSAVAREYELCRVDGRSTQSEVREVG